MHDVYCEAFYYFFGAYLGFQEQATKFERITESYFGTWTGMNCWLAYVVAVHIFAQIQSSWVRAVKLCFVLKGFEIVPPILHAWAYTR